MGDLVLAVQKWSKGKVREKLNNLVVFDQQTYDRMLAEVFVSMHHSLLNLCPVTGQELQACDPIRHLRAIEGRLDRCARGRY